MYLSTNIKFVLSLLGAILWLALSLYLAQPWFHQLSDILTPYVAAAILGAIAILPGFMNAFVVFSLLLDKRPELVEAEYWGSPEVDIIIAAYNEEDVICSTIDSILKQKYSGLRKIIVVNDGSTDNTIDVLRENYGNHSKVQIVNLLQNQGKANALNTGLVYVKTDIFITVDADSFLYKNSLTNLIGRYMSDPPSAAIAGAVLVRNSRKNMVTKVQEWDYFHGIAAIKRIQSLYQGTLVAQGAYTLYNTEIVQSLNGWKNTVGEDIVLTWEMLAKGYRVGYAENAVAFTNTPDTWKQFFHQRARWARGILEALRNSPEVLTKVRKTQMFIWWNLSFLYIDLVYTFVFIPGLILALFGNFLIAGPITLLVLPLGLLVNFIMFKRSNKMFQEQGLQVRSNILGFIGYSMFYNIVLQPASVFGYAMEVLKYRKSWGTK